MIPWPIVHLIDIIAALFGWDCYVTTRSGSWGALKIGFRRRVPGTPRPRRLRAYDGGPLTPGDIGLTLGAGVGSRAIIEMGPSGPLPRRG